MGKKLILRLLFLSFFLLASVVNSTHIVEACSDEIVQTHNSNQHGEGENHYHSTGHNGEDCHQGESNSHHCCHQHNFLVGQGDISFYTNDRLIVGVTPQQLISDPHPRGPFQPPRA